MAGTFTPGTGADFHYRGTTDGGAPSTGDFVLGDWVETPTGIALCRLGGTPGTWSDFTFTPSGATVPPALVPGSTLFNQGNSPYWLATNAARTVMYALFTNDRVVKKYSIVGESSDDFTLGLPLATSPVLGTGPAAIGVAPDGRVFVTDQNDLTLKELDSELAAVTATFLYDSSGGGGGGRFAINATSTKILIGGPETGANANKAALVDISTPGAPTVSGGLGGRTPVFGSTHRGVAFLSGTSWAVASRDDHKVFTVDASTPATPTAAVSITTTNGNTTTPLKYFGGFLYVGNYGVGYLEKWDYTNPAAPAFVAAIATAVGSEQIDISSDGAYVAIGCRPSNEIVVVRTSDMQVVAAVIVAGTITPGVAFGTNFIYLVAAGDTSNGIIYTFRFLPNVAQAISTVSGRISAISAASPKLAGSNAFTGKQTLSAAVAMLLSSDTAEIDWGTTTPFAMKRTGVGLMQLDADLRVLAVRVYPSGSTVLRAFAAGSDSQPKARLEVDGLHFGPGGSTATDVRLSRTGVDRLRLFDHFTADLGVATMEIDSTGKTTAQIDALWAATPPNGTIVSDPTNHLVLVRQGGSWYKSAALTLIP